MIRPQNRIMLEKAMTDDSQGNRYRWLKTLREEKPTKT